METKKALIKREATETSLILEIGETPLKIILTEDNPNNIKIAFNSLLRELKKGEFKFQLEDEISDLYSNICKEYINQLNAEIKIVYKELMQSGVLVND